MNYYSVFIYFNSIFLFCFVEKNKSIGNRQQKYEIIQEGIEVSTLTIPHPPEETLADRVVQQKDLDPSGDESTDLLVFNWPEE